MKRKIKTASCVFVLILTLILNIVLLSTNVFQGTYQNTSVGAKITLYDNTYNFDILGERTYSFRERGFFGYYELNKMPTRYSDFKNDLLTLVPNGKNDSSHIFERKNVFCISLYDSSSLSIEGQNFYCGEAIALQVVYAVLMLVSIIVLFVEYREEIKGHLRHLKSPSDK